MPVVATSSALEESVRRLAGLATGETPFVSCYLDVDGRRQPRHLDLERRLATVLRLGRARLNGHADDPGVRADLARIEEWVKAGFDRSRTRGLAFFASGAQGVFEVVPLPFAVHDRLVVNAGPALGPLEAILHDHEPVGVLLADRRGARLLVSELGEVEERARIEEAESRGDPGHHDRGDLEPAAMAERHARFRRAADLAWQEFQARPFAHLVVGAREAVVAELEGLLHPYLRDRLRGRVTVPTTASLGDVRDAVVEVEREVDHRRQVALVDKLRAEAGRAGRGVTGLAATLAALNEHRVECLLVSAGYEEEGWRCPTTGELAAVGPTSKVTGEAMTRVDDVVVDAIDVALTSGCRVEITEVADLDVAGRIGALLRY